MATMRTCYGVVSDVGLKRANNEDRFCAEPALGLYVVCDGMGGRNTGEIASALAIETIQQHMREAARRPDLPLIGVHDPAFSPQANRLAAAIRLANQIIYEQASQRPECAGMGTTVAAILIRDQILSIAHVGDSRLYLIRNHTIQPLTIDHSLVAEQVRQGLIRTDEAQRSSRKNVLTRAVGVQPTVEVELGEIPVRTHDLLLLCSDGLTHGVTSCEILQSLSGSDDPQTMSQRLVAMANAAGGEDNTTVMLIALGPDNQPGVWQRIRDRFWRRAYQHAH